MGTLHRRSAAGSTRARGTTRTATATTTTAAAAAAGGATGDPATGATTPTPCSRTGKEQLINLRCSDNLLVFTCMYFAKLDLRLLIHCPADRSILLVVDVGKKASEGVKSSEWVMSMWRPPPRCSFAAVARPRKSMVGAEQPARTTQTWRKTLTTLSLSEGALLFALSALY